MAAPQPGDRVRAKRLGWRGDMNFSERDDLDPYDYEDPDVEGVLHVVDATGPFVDRHTNYLVNGQSVDPDTIELASETEEVMTATLCGRPTLDGTPCQRPVAQGHVDCGLATGHRPTRPVATIPTGLLRPQRPGQPGEAVLVAHLPGKHDQASHGKGGHFDGAAMGDEGWRAAPLTAESELPDELNGVKSDAIYRALFDYTNSGFSTLNRGLRHFGGDNPQLGESNRATIKGLDAIMKSSELKRDVISHRGVRKPELVFGDAWKSDGDMTGTTWIDHGYVSTSTEERKARRFTGNDNVIMHVRSPKGTRAIGVASNEYELLLDRGQRYRVVGDRRGDDSARLLDVEVVK